MSPGIEDREHVVPEKLSGSDKLSRATDGGKLDVVVAVLCSFLEGLREPSPFPSLARERSERKACIRLLLVASVLLFGGATAPVLSFKKERKLAEEIGWCLGVAAAVPDKSKHE